MFLLSPKAESYKAAHAAALVKKCWLAYAQKDNGIRYRRRKI
jgi:hypothetical protein